MKLYEMLKQTKYYQKVWIFETNAFDQNMPIFNGIVDDARADTERTWDYLMCDVEDYDCTTGTLVIRIRDEYYEKRLESHYLFGEKWGKERKHRPWMYSSEIDMELRKKDEND